MVQGTVATAVPAIRETVHISGSPLFWLRIWARLMETATNSWPEHER